MNVNELKERFDEIDITFSSTVQNCLLSCQCDVDTRNALDEIARQAFYALAETQDAIIEYLKKN